MTIGEMHIDLALKLRKIGLEVYDQYEPEEVDWILNEHQYRFVRYCANPKSNERQEGFQFTQYRLDSLEELLTKTNLPVFYRDARSVYADLPLDYLELVNDRTWVCPCDTPSVTGTSAIVYNYALGSFLSRFVPEEEGDEPTLIGFNLIANVTIDGSPTIITLFTADDYFINPITEADVSMFITTALQVANSVGAPYNIQVYYENYGTLQYPGQFIIVDTSTEDPTLAGATTQSDGFRDDITLAVPINRTGYAYTNCSQMVERDNRLTKTEDIYRILQDSFGRTDVDSPVSAMERGTLIVYHDDRFGVSSISIEYIRNPRLMSYANSISCELGSRAGTKYDICRQIVDSAVSSIAARIAADNVQLQFINNLKSE